MAALAVGTVSPEQALDPLVLALDVGTSSCRASLYDGRGRRVDDLASQLSYTPTTTADGGAELDPERLLERVCRTIDALASRGGPLLERVAAVATSTFWHSLLGLAEDGRPLTPLYLWMDARSHRQAAALQARLDERAIHARTGCVLHWSYWPARLRWLAEARPDLLSRVARWVGFGEYLALRLCGQRAVSLSMASGTGLLDQHRRNWDEDLLTALSVSPAQLSPLVAGPGASDGRPTGSVGLGAPYTARWPALARAAWLPAVGDGACSNLGAGCATRERLALMIGTSGAVRALWPAPDLEIPWGTWCYRADGQRFVVGGAMNDGGSLLGWLRETLRLPPLEQAEAAVGALEPDGHGLSILPLWAGERSPGWAADARGAVVGLRLHTDPVEILRAALEAVALYLGRIAGLVRRAVPEVREVVATGGALLHSPTWLQIVADVLDQPVLASSEPEASSRGAALLALEALGALSGGLEALGPTVERVYEPIPAHVVRYRAAAERQARLYDLLVAR